MPRIDAAQQLGGPRPSGARRCRAAASATWSSWWLPRSGGRPSAQARTGRIIPQTNEEYGYEDHYPLWAPAPPGDSAETLRRTAVRLGGEMELCHVPFDVEEGLRGSLQTPPATLLVLPNGWVKVAAALVHELEHLVAVLVVEELAPEPELVRVLQSVPDPDPEPEPEPVAADATSEEPEEPPPH